jgi:hypothetical protein
MKKVLASALIWPALSSWALAQTGLGAPPAAGYVPFSTGSTTGAVAWATAGTVFSSVNCTNISAYSGKGDNTTDNTTPYNNAIAALTGAQKCLYFPAGKYKFNSTPNVWSTLSNSDSIAVVGDGADTTELTFPTVGTGFAISLQNARNSVHWRNVSVTTALNGSGVGGGYAISVTQNGSGNSPAYDAPNDFTGVTIRGVDGYDNAGNNYWLTGVVITNLSNVNWVGNTFIGPGASGYATVGTGVLVKGTYSAPNCTTFPVAHNFIGGYFNVYGTGVQVGECVQGLVFNAVNFTGGKYGIHIPTGLHGLTELAIVASQFNQATAGYLAETFMNNLTISGNTFYVVDPLNAGSAGVNLTTGSGAYTINGNTFNLIGANTLTGLILNQNLVWYSNVYGNIFYSSGVGVTNATGINIQSGGDNNFVYGNSLSALTTNIVNSGTNNFIWPNFPEYSYTIAQVLALTCSSATKGRIVVVSDTVGAAAPTYGGTVAGGGATALTVPAFCDGSGWRYH